MIGIGQRQIRKSAAWTETTGKALYREKAEAKQINYLNVYSLSIRLALLGKVQLVVCDCLSLGFDYYP